MAEAGSYAEVFYLCIKQVFIEYLLCSRHWGGHWNMKTNTIITMQYNRYYDRVCQLYSRSTWVQHPKKIGDKELESLLENLI